MRNKITLLVALMLTLSCTGAFAAYTRFQSLAVTIQTIYANELGSPFIVVTPTVNATCAGLYLYDISVATPSSAQIEYRKNKMAVLMTAMASGKQVTLELRDLRRRSERHTAEFLYARSRHNPSHPA